MDPWHQKMSVSQVYHWNIYRLIPAKGPSFYKFAIPLTFVIFNIFSFSFIPLHHGKYCLALCWIVGSSNKKKTLLRPPPAPPAPATACSSLSRRHCSSLLLPPLSSPPASPYSFRRCLVLPALVATVAGLLVDPASTGASSTLLYSLLEVGASHPDLPPSMASSSAGAQLTRNRSTRMEEDKIKQLYVLLVKLID